jgi:hypothetical membrane protein
METMKNATLQKALFYAGAVSGLIFISVTLLLGELLQNYNSLSQTVSEIGQIGSPFRLPYTLMLFSASLFGLIFSYKALEFTKSHSLSKAPIILIAFFALLDAGFAIFPAPEPMHNIVGLLHLPCYFAPLVVAITWKRYFTEQQLTNFSGLAFLSIIVFIILNLSPMFAPKLIPVEYYGVMQRGLIYSYNGWLIWLSITMAKQVSHNSK